MDLASGAKPRNLTANFDFDIGGGLTAITLRREEAAEICRCGRLMDAASRCFTLRKAKQISARLMSRAESCRTSLLETRQWSAFAPYLMRRSLCF